MSTLAILIVLAVVIAVLWVVFFWYQNRRANEANKDIDRSKLKDLDKDRWND